FRPHGAVRARDRTGQGVYRVDAAGERGGSRSRGAVRRGHGPGERHRSPWRPSGSPLNRACGVLLPIVSAVTLPALRWSEDRTGAHALPLRATGGGNGAPTWESPPPPTGVSASVCRWRAVYSVRSNQRFE